MSKDNNITGSEVRAFDNDIITLISDINGVLGKKHPTREEVISGIYGLLKRYFEFFYRREGINESVNDGVLLWYTYHLSDDIISIVTAPENIFKDFSVFSFSVSENGFSLFHNGKEYGSFCYDGFFKDEPGNLKLNLENKKLSFGADSIGTMEFVNFEKKHQCKFDEFGVLESIVIDDNRSKRQFDICPHNKLLSDFMPLNGQFSSIFYSLRPAGSNESVSLGANANANQDYLRTFWALPLLSGSSTGIVKEAIGLMFRKHFDKLYKITELIREWGYEEYRYGSEPYSYGALVLQKNGNAPGVSIFGGEKNDQPTADISGIGSVNYSSHNISYTTVYNDYGTPKRYMCDLGNGSVLRVIWEVINADSENGLGFNQEPEDIYIKAVDMQNLFGEQCLKEMNPYNAVVVGFMRTFKEGNVEFSLLTKRPLDNNGHLAGESLKFPPLEIDGIIPDVVQYIYNKRALFKQASSVLAPAHREFYGK